MDEQPHAMDFTGRAVLVTGGTKGLGATIARAFLASGADVMACGRSTPAALPSTGGREAGFRVADLRDPVAVADVVAAASERFGRLDALVNNAGGSPDADAATVSPRFVEKVVALNLLAPSHTAQAANLAMREQPGGGSVINIGSVSAHTPQPGTAAYSAAKAGLLGLTRAPALEWAPRVGVNHITAGFIRTESAAALYGEEGGNAAVDVVPMGRPAEPDGVARACLWPACDLSSYVNGADLAVHGCGEIPARHTAAHRPTSL
ncbi:SDR family oxidoreductase [Streptomyces globisporus]|uniref:SDR family oxidoreductase n=1 Tax=Streptomyces globisporus TaxID=1908 RepID=UPI003682F522